MKKKPIQETEYIQKQRCKRDKNNYLNRVCLEMEYHCHKNETRDGYGKIKQITSLFTSCYVIIRWEGAYCLTDTKQIKNI